MMGGNTELAVFELEKTLLAILARLFFFYISLLYVLH